MYTEDEIRELIADDRLAYFYKDYDWRTLALKIIRLYHGECQLCKAEHRLTKATTVHHVKHLRTNPELAYNRDNLLPLCHDCHERIHQRGIYSEPSGYTNAEKW